MIHMTAVKSPVKERQKAWYTAGIQLLVVVAVTLLLLEGVGVVAYFLQHGEIYYVKTADVETPEDREEPADQVLQTKQVLHPYLGFAYRSSLPMSRVADTKRIAALLYGRESDSSWTSLATNNHGFYADIDYPYQRASQRQLLIGVFGGSVAQWFALQGAGRLKQELQKHPFFKDRDIVVLNYAQGGFKQPQQVQALSYFLTLGQEFDIVVNIDGFNEIALSHINHVRKVDTSMPGAQQLLPLLGLMARSGTNMEMIHKLLELRQSELDLMRLERWKSATNSAGMHLVLSLLYARAQNQFPSEQQALASLSDSLERTGLVHLSALPNAFSLSESTARAMNFWLGAAVTMQEICNAKGIPYLEVIQPNQYFTKKDFSAEEREIAINEDSPYREPIESGYQNIPDMVKRMRQSGVNAVSAVDIFDNVSEPVYSDSCCHYNQAGNEMLADLVAGSLATLVDGGSDAGPGSHAGDNAGHSMLQQDLQ